MQRDGNFVTYNSKEVSTWAAHTWREGVMAALLLDGNLVVYDEKNRVVWESGTDGVPKPGVHLVMQNDGKLAIIHSGQILWHT